MEKSKRFAAPEAAIRLWFWLFAAAALIAAICMPDRGQMFAGLGRLCVLPYQSANPYFAAENGGFAGTFLNVALVCAICAAVYSLPGSKPDGVSVLAFFLTAGFAFWGITVLNIWFCFAGTLIVCLIRKVNPCTQGNVFLFSTGIAPLMTDLLIRYPGADAHGVTFFGCVLALLACCLIGLILPAGLTHGPKMHKGYDLYNAAVPIGLVAFFLRAVLYRVLGGTLADGVGVGAGEVLLANSLKTLLEKKGFTVEVAYDGETGKDYAETGVYDLLILDVMMPKLNGYDLARQVRAERCATPILMLTAKGELEDRIEGLNAGADYYLTKPFDTRELLACINALLRRQGDQVDELRFGNTALDLASGMLVCGAERVRLSAKEFDIMRFLLQSKGNNLSKEVLLARVWGFDSNAVENHVEVYVGFLRKKLASIGSNVRIEAVRRLGYHLEVANVC